jgi:chromosomal replication initiator protein
VEPATANGRELDVLWPAILDSLAPNQRVWLASSKPVMLAESTAVIAVPNEFTRTQLEGRLRTRLEDALSESLNKPIRIAVTVDDTLAPATSESESGAEAGQAGPAPTSSAPSPLAPSSPGAAERAYPGGPPSPGSTYGPTGRAQASLSPIHQQNDLSTNIQMGAASLTTGIPDSPINPR